MKKTFKQVITEFENFADNHAMINEFGWGQLSDITTKDHTYPMMWVNPTPSVNEGTNFILNIEVYIIDLEKQDGSNKLDIMSSTLLTLNDFIAEYVDSEDDNDFALNEESITVTPFNFRFDDVTSGWIGEIEIEIQNTLNQCQIPKD